MILERKARWILIVMLAFVGIMASESRVEAKTYTISTKTKPGKKIRKKKTYNKNTKNYYTIQYYLDKLEKTGGTLNLKKGTYKIPRTIYIPSNVTIQCKNGVVLKKTNKTGTKKLKTTKIMFQTVSTKDAKKKRKIAKYTASKNVAIKGSGAVTVNLAKENGATAIYVGHADKVTIQNITFKNKLGGSYIWVEGSRNVSINKCKFLKAGILAGAKNQMAIRLEVIHSEINGFSGKWSKLDSTVNKNITITNNEFIALETGVGTVKYAAENADGEPKIYYQTGIKIKNNTFTDMGKNAVKAMGWKKPAITTNVMKRSAAGTKTPIYVNCFGVYNPNISSNTFVGCQYVIRLDAISNTGKGSKMPRISSMVEDSFIEKMKKNTLTDVQNQFVLLDNVKLFYFQNKEEKNFTINVNSIPYQEKYMDSIDYAQRKNYYVFISYMEQLEYAGGGTITVEAGNYPVTNNICIPSNVTLHLKDGVTFTKAGTTATDICYAKSIFTIVPPSKDGTKETIDEYNGSQNVQILGNGTVVFDCADVLNSMALVMGHANNVTIRGITFRNQNGSHFIEMNSSRKVTVENCSFIGFKPYELKSHKECINIDGTDYNTNGFNYDWSAHDKTPCKDIVIRNNYFENIGTAIGSHTYMAEGELLFYHENVQIYDNDINGTYNAAVRMLNWKNPIVKRNTFRNIQSLEDGKLNEQGEQTKYVGMLLRGVVNPTITENTFDTCNYYPIRVILLTPPTSETTTNAGYPATECVITEEEWGMMQKNTLLHVKEKFQWIVIRENPDQADSAAEKKEFLAE